LWLPGPHMRSSPHLILVLLAILGSVWANPARNARELEEGSGDELIEVDLPNETQGSTEEESKVKISQDSESEISSTESIPESENEVDIDLATEEEKLAEAEKKDNEKCKKCLKPTWRGRHASICKTCEIKGVIKTVDKKDEDHVEKCKKCVRRKFKARHALFCSECPDPDLYDEQQNVNSDNKKHKKKGSKKPMKEEDKKEEELEDEIKDKRKNKNKNQTKKHADSDKPNKKAHTEQKDKLQNKDEVKNKNHKKNKKNKKDKNKKNKHKNKPHDTKKETSNIKSATTVMNVEDEIELNTPETNLGPLGSLIKYLVKSNTFKK